MSLKRLQLREALRSRDGSSIRLEGIRALTGQGHIVKAGTGRTVFRGFGLVINL
jgi:hypothetical protein